ncbi:MAG: ABC transporter substrate-binding protein [Betaproteobacteria bacterium]|nr:ABC transporter substrate-binding protein [Betaproteobacteria bacterium]
MKIAHLIAVAVVCISMAPPTQAEPGVSANEILIGQDIDMSGTIAARMKPLVQAADAYFDQVNRRGGVHGRKIKVIRLDNANKPDKTKENVKQLVEKNGVFAMWGISGTGNVGAALPYLNEKRVPLIGTTSGAETFYGKTHPYLINIKASYADEINRLATHFKALGIQKIGLIYLDNGFGREALKSAQSAAAEQKLDVVGISPFKEDGTNIEQAVLPIAAAKPQAVFLLTLAGPAPKLVEAYLKTGDKTQFFALSIVATDVLFKAIGDNARGIVVTQVVPFPWDGSMPISREFQELMKSINVTDYSMSGMEGYVLARTLVEGLRAAGKNPTRDGLIAAYEGMRDKDLGGMRLSYSPEDHNGSTLVDITMIGKGGKLVR